MKTGRILIVEDDFDISNLLRIFFDGEGYDVEVASRGTDALAAARQMHPNLIILDILLPDMDGYAVCKELRMRPRTRHIPIIFLTRKDDRSDRISGLELGADDYITKPFDIEELKLRAQNAIARAERDNLLDPRTGLPTGIAIEEELKRILYKDNWTLLDCGIMHLSEFKAHYGFMAMDRVLEFTSRLVLEVVDELQGDDDFVGHAGGGNFLIISFNHQAPGIWKELKLRFLDELPSLLTSLDGGALKMDGDSSNASPELSLSIGVLRADEQDFENIFQVTKSSANARRLDGK
jgi:DNA-binding response OmpR family regulator